MTSTKAHPKFSEVTLALRYLKAPLGSGVVVDVGASQGQVSKTFARHGWRCVSFEPAKDSFEALEREMGEWPDALLIPKAVTDQTRQDVAFYRSAQSTGLHSLFRFHESQGEETVVDATRLDDALDERDIAGVDALIIDIGAGNYRALRSLDLTRFRPRLVAVAYVDERSSVLGDTPSDLVRHMTGHGYAAFISEWRAGAPDSGDVFVRCAPYPVPHHPGRGWLVFVPEDDAATFDEALTSYLAQLAADALDTVDQLQRSLRRSRRQARKLRTSVRDQALRLAQAPDVATPPASAAEKKRNARMMRKVRQDQVKLARKVARLERRLVAVEQRVKRGSVWRRAARKVLKPVRSSG